VTRFDKNIVYSTNFCYSFLVIGRLFIHELLIILRGDNLLDILANIFDLYFEAVTAVYETRIVYYNKAAKKLLPEGFENRDISALVNKQLLEHEADNFVSTANIEGKSLGLIVTRFKDHKIFSFISSADTDEYLLASEILTNVSAEIRNIMAIIRMASGLIFPAIEKIQDEQLDKYAATLNHGFYEMLRLTNNMAYSKNLLENNFNLNMKNFDIVRLCRNLVETVKATVVDKDLNLGFETKTESKIIYGDSVRIEQMLLNLFSNSIKYTPPGGKITLSLAAKEESLSLAVSDTGEGIPSDKMVSVWSQFSSNKHKDAKSGVGLGLPIVQQISRSHGGCAVLESRENGGTCVTIRLPILVSIKNTFSEPIVGYEPIAMREILTELSDVLSYQQYSSNMLD
jgi:signal transduction histidine kinase